MYCQRCGQEINRRDTVCPHCGTHSGTVKDYDTSDDKPSFGLAVLGFFIPLAGLIIYLVEMKAHPKRAKSAGKGALSRVIIHFVLCVLLIIIYALGLASVINHVIEPADTYPVFNPDIIYESVQTPEEQVGILFGDFTVIEGSYYPETSLEVTVTNHSDTRYTYYITIEAVDETGARLDTDMIYADRLNPGQSIHLTAFEYVGKDDLESFKTASFQILEINCYDW